MDYQPQTRSAITKVWARNFRSIESMEMDLGHLTVLVGPNASGKSNCMDVVRFVADALRHDLEAAITDRGGIESIRRRPARGRAYGPEIGLQLESPEFQAGYGFAIANKGAGGYQVRQEYIRVERKEATANLLEIEVRNGTLTKPNLKRIRGKAGQLSGNAAFAERLAAQQFDPKELNLTSEQRRSLLTLLLVVSDRYDFTTEHVISSLNSYLSDMRFYHIFPNALRDPQSMGDRYPLEERGENLASVLRDMIQEKSSFLQDLKGALALVVPSVRDVRVQQLGSFLVVELKHEDTQQRAWFDLSYESDGTLRLLGLLVALYQTPPPSLIAIEEPELTIHPGALSVLADIMQEASLRSQILVTTHSPDLIDRLPIESVRAVEVRDGVTTVGPVAEQQREAVRRGLFSPGDLHRMEGLQIARNRD